MRPHGSWREPKVPTYALALFYVLIAWTGVVGFFAPSVNVARVIGLGYLIFAVGMVVFGLLGLIALRLGLRGAEAAVILGIAVLTVLYGAMVYSAADGHGIQTGTRLFASLPGAVAMSWYRRHHRLSDIDLAAQIRAHEALRSLEGDR